jgi:hypothetical protein
MCESPKLGAMVRVLDIRGWRSECDNSSVAELQWLLEELSTRTVRGDVISIMSACGLI